MIFLNKVLWLIEKTLMIVILLAIFLISVNFVQINLLKKAHINVFGYSIFEVVSNSMAPKINKKDVIIVKIDKKVKVGDVVTFKSGNSFVTHRVIFENNDSYVTKGDYNNATDKPVAKKDLIGEVVLILPKLGLWRDIVRTPQILISFFVVIFSLNNFSPKVRDSKEVLKLKKKYKKDFKITSSGIIEGK